MNLPKLQQPKLQQAIHPFAMKTIHMQLFSHHTQMIKSLPLTFIDPINRMDGCFPSVDSSSMHMAKHCYLTPSHCQ